MKAEQGTVTQKIPPIEKPQQITNQPPAGQVTQTNTQQTNNPHSPEDNQQQVPSETATIQETAIQDELVSVEQSAQPIEDTSQNPANPEIQTTSDDEINYKPFIIVGFITAVLLIFVVFKFVIR